MKRFSAILFLFLLTCSLSKAQNVALKSNLLYDVLGNVNLGVEMGLSPRWTLDVSADYNGWTMPGDRKYKHLFIQPEARYWFCEKFAGHFLGFHAQGGIFNVGHLPFELNLPGLKTHYLKDNRYQGWLAGVGIAYGYTWMLSTHWSLEAEIGIGVNYVRYDVFPCVECGNKLVEDAHRVLVSPTKAALNLVYDF